MRHGTAPFLVLEGLDGCGKSTQAQRLVARLEATGLRVLHTREPGGTPAGERIRNLLLDPASGALHPRTEVFLYQAARAQLVTSRIGPALEAGHAVVCERWHYATEAYQTAAHDEAAGASVDFVRETSSWATGGVEPNRAFLLDLPLADGRERLGTDLDRIEARGDAYRVRVAEGYRRIFRRDHARFVTVDATGSIDAVHEAIWAHVEGLLA